MRLVNQPSSNYRVSRSLPYFMATPFRFSRISQGTHLLPWVWVDFSDTASLLISSFRTCQSRLQNFGGAGIFPLHHGCANIFTSRLAETEKGHCELISIFSW